MATLPPLENQLRAHRLRCGWSQGELARRSGLSRAGISAIEIDRLVPSTAAALALAAALSCRVEDLFFLRTVPAGAADWAWPPRRAPCRYWRAAVAGRVRLYPVEATPLGVMLHDGVYQAGTFQDHGGTDPARTLVMACCDPAAGLLAAELARSTGVRLIALQRSSAAALALLGQGLVHVAGVHLAPTGAPDGNAATVRSRLGPGYSLLRVAAWEEGVAHAPDLKLSSISAAVRSELRWVGREVGSGARQCLDELIGEGRPPGRLASDHRGVAEAVRNGWADAGVCLRLVSEEAGLDFLSVREEVYDLCFPASWEGDPQAQALVNVVRSSTYRRALGELPGYDSSTAGALGRVPEGKLPGQDSNLEKQDQNLL